MAQEDRDLIAAGYSLALSENRHHRVLSGVDDGGPFSVEVPLRILGIAEALEWLRPDGVSASDPRQGEWFFVPCAAPPATTRGWELVAETEAGSTRERMVYDAETFDVRRRHMPAECRVVEERGETAFLGRRAVSIHSWSGRPHIYVRGEVTHPEHETVTLETWHEVIPNRAHGPFQVGDATGGLD